MALIVFIINIFRDRSYRGGWVGGNIDGGPLKWMRYEANT